MHVMLPLCERATRRLLVISLATSAITAQTNWSLLTPATSPPERHGHSGMAYDSARDLMVMYGGRGGPTIYRSDTWEFTGTTWVQRFPTIQPGPLTGHALEYDRGRARTVLFGGHTGVGYSGFTWEWDGTNWQLASPTASPSPRSYHSMAYDSARGVVVLFGGTNANIASQQTWEYDGTTWLLRTLAASPPARQNHGMCYDSARQRMVVFGGWNPNGYRSDTWEWDGSNAGWVQRSSVTVPSARRGHLMTYDAARGRTVMVGGHAGAGRNSETWEWDGTNWSLRTPTVNPSARSSAGSAFDSVRRRMVMFGGGNGSVLFPDTWAYAPVTPALAEPFGVGCAGPAGVPVMGSDPSAWPSSLPWRGATFHAQLSNLGSDPTHVPLRVVGVSNSSWNGAPLPLGLGLLGMPGCTLYTDLVSVEVLGNNGGVADWSLAIPGGPSLTGVEIYAQGFVLVAGWNAFGMVASNALRLQVGSK